MQRGDGVRQVHLRVGDLASVTQLTPQRKGRLTRMARAFQAVQPVGDHQHASPRLGECGAIFRLCRRPSLGDEAVEPVEPFKILRMRGPEATQVRRHVQPPHGLARLPGPGKRGAYVLIFDFQSRHDCLRLVHLVGKRQINQPRKIAGMSPPRLVPFALGAQLLLSVGA